jgi:hypothetical protein
MADRPHQQEVLHAVEALLSEQAEYRRWRREEVRRRGGYARRNGPVAFDESGFPIPAGRPSFAQRVARLLNV